MSMFQQLIECFNNQDEDFTNMKDDFFYKGDIQMFFQSDKFEKLKLPKLDDVGKQGNFQTIVTRKIEKSECHSKSHSC